MSKLAQEALESCAALLGNLDKLQALVLAACPREKLDAIRIEFGNVRMNLGQIKARVPTACVVEEVKDLPTHATPRPAPEVPHVPAFPDRPLKPPPEHYHEGTNA